MQVSKWGNSLAVRLPAAVVEQMRLKEGDDLDIQSMSGDVLRVRRAITREETIAALRRIQLNAPKGYTFSRKDAYPDGEY